MFKNRQHAGILLAEKLLERISEKYRHLPVVVVALPRGGIPVAIETVLLLQCPLDILVSKKIPSAGNRELAVGAVTSSGTIIINEELAKLTHSTEAYIEAETRRLVPETRLLEEHWLKSAGIHIRPSLRNKLVIIIDDGVATGMTTLASLQSVQGQGAQAVILATPVMAIDAISRLQNECTEIVAVATPKEFEAVGNFYMDFHQIEEPEMLQSLKRAVAD